MILHHHTKFGKKWLSGSGDIERTQEQNYRQKDGLSDSNIHPPPPLCIYSGGGGSLT